VAPILVGGRFDGIQSDLRERLIGFLFFQELARFTRALDGPEGLDDSVGIGGNAAIVDRIHHGVPP